MTVGGIALAAPQRHQFAHAVSDGNVYAYSIKIASAHGDPQGVATGPGDTQWFTESANGKIGRVAADGSVKEFALPSGAEPKGITLGPDHAMWFADQSGKVGRITLSGAVAEYPVSGGGDIESIAVGPDGNLWFAVRLSKEIGRITTAGSVTIFPVPQAADITDLASGPGGVWFTDYTNDLIGRITVAGAVTTYRATGNPGGLVEGPDGNEWVAEYKGGDIDKVTPGGKITRYALPSGSNADPASLVVGTDKDLWVAEEGTNKVARVDPSHPQPANTYEYGLPTGTGPDAIADPEGTIIVGGFDGNNLVELMFMSLSAPAIAAGVRDAQEREAMALSWIEKNPDHDIEVTMARAIGALKSALDDFGGNTNPVTADLNTALSHDEATLKIGSGPEIASDLKAAGAAKAQALKVLQALIPVR